MLLFDEPDPEREVIFLLDEPDTHFNPQWRSEFFQELDQVLNNKTHEIILTTHSPFILGDCHGYNVFQFERDKDTVTFQRSEYETYGANFEYLLKNMFHFEFQMSDKSRDHLLKLEKAIKAAAGKLKVKSSKRKFAELQTQLKLYGESVEKLYVMNQLDDLRKKLKIKS